MVLALRPITCDPVYSITQATISFLTYQIFSSKTCPSPVSATKERWKEEAQEAGNKTKDNPVCPSPHCMASVSGAGHGYLSDHLSGIRWSASAATYTV